MNNLSMRARDRMLAAVLTYAGTVPLTAAAALSVSGHASLINPPVAFMAYGAIILSFLAGMHWAAYLFFAQRSPRNLLLTSNIIALIAWLGLLLPMASTVWLEILGFLYMLALDLRLREAAILPAWFYALRRNATILVVLSLLILSGIL